MTKKVDAWEDSKGKLHKTEEEALVANNQHVLYQFIDEVYPIKDNYRNHMFGTELKREIGKILSIVKKYEEYVYTQSKNK